MKLPNKCKMDDLSDIEPLLIGWLLIRLIVQGDQGFSRKGEIYRKIFVRLIDKAIYEYQQAREAILAQVEDKERPAKDMQKIGRISYILLFTNHLENCINAIRRLFHLIDRIKNEKDDPNISRILRKQIESLGSSIVTIRDSIEHIDEIIMRDELGNDQPILIAVTDNEEGIQLLDDQLKFCDLALTIRKLHEIAKYLIICRDNLINKDS